MRTAWLIGLCLAATLVSFGSAQEDLNPNNRQELKRAALSGTNMEVIISVIEVKPGEGLSRHIHHGEEAFYEFARRNF